MSSSQSILVGVVLTTAFLIIGGLALLAVCSIFDNRPASPIKRFRPFARFTLSSLGAALICSGLLVWLVMGFPDHEFPTDPAPTLGEQVLRGLTEVAIWPLEAASLIQQGDPPVPILWFIPTGMFWGSLIELAFALKSRKQGDLPLRNPLPSGS